MHDLTQIDAKFYTDIELGAAVGRFRTELRCAIRDGRLAGRELPRRIPDVLRDLREAESAYARALNLALDMADRVLAPLGSGRTREAFASVDFVQAIDAWDAAQAAAHEARRWLDAVQREAIAMLQPDVIAQS